MREQVFPTSFSQQRLWFLDQFEPGTAAYNLPRTFRLTGRLDARSLTGAINAAVSRHESLRTVFTSTDGEPFQVVLAALKIDVPTIDLRHLRVEEREETAFRVAGEEARKPFDLAAGPLLRATVLQLAPEDHVLVLVMHHIITDGWSMGLLFDEIGEHYTAFTTGRDLELPALPIQYSDYANWQKQALSGDSLTERLGYWRSALKDAQTLLELPTDRPRMPIHSGRGDDVYLQLSEKTAEQLKDLAQKEGATLFMALLTVFQILLRRYTAQESILIGTPAAGRDEVEIENLIGFFVNTLVIRADITGDESFRQLLRQARSTTLNALAHADVPFEKLVEALEPERQVNRNPLFQAMFVFQNIPRQQLDMSGLVLQEVEFESGIAKFDLTLEVIELEGLRCKFEFDSDLFDKTTIERMAGHFETLLEGILADPDQRVSNLPLLTEPELQQLSVFNSTRSEYPRELCIHSCFEQQAERRPNAVALVCEGPSGSGEVSFGALNRLANRLAHRLIRQGVRPGDLVGISFKRSVSMMAGLLGILKAGAAYVPLDPSYPEKRLAFMVQDSQVQCIVTSRDASGPVREAAGNVLLMDVEDQIADNGPGEGEDCANPSLDLSADMRAYVIYTSGSTGTPKGVEGTHRASMNRLAWMWQAYPFRADEICCQKTALGFVDSVWEIFGPLLAGVRSVLIPDEAVLDITYLVQVLAGHRVSRIVMVPSLLRVLLEQVEDLRGKLPNLKLWSASGEVLPASVARQFAELLPDATLLNIYGSSEVAADATWHEIQQPAAGTSVPIGRPIANVQVHILDDSMERVPIGVRGEIFIGGDALARGYWNRAELTRERFLPSPFTNRGSDRLYRTGDLGRYLANGEIEYLGRSDNQVKLRGMRVELEEIESALAAHRRIFSAAVVLAGLADQQKLVGYLVICPGVEIDPEEVRHFLRTKLPDHMVPSQYLTIDALPLLPNGKVDRKNLSHATSARVVEHRRYVAPQTDVEEKMAQVWCEVLGLEEIGIHDNFFELGGHSLMVIQVIARIRRVFEVEIPVRSLFEEPTIERSAKAVEESLAKGIKARLPIVARRKPTASPNGREALMAQLGAMSEDEVHALLSQILQEKAVRQTDLIL